MNNLHRCISSTYQMRLVTITSLPNDDTTVIELDNGSKKKTFRRPVDEILTKTVARMMCSMEPKKKKKKSQVSKLQNLNDDDDETGSITIDIFDSENQLISLHQEGLKAWKLASYMHINKEIYTILFNPPSVKNIALSSLPLIGMPLMPMLQFSLASSNYSRFTWYRSIKSYTQMDKVNCDTNDEVMSRKRSLSHGDKIDKAFVSNVLQNKSDWSEVGKELVYTPTNNDIGHIIMLEVEPGSELYPFSKSIESFTTVSAKSGVVQSGPTTCLFDKRHMQIKSFSNEKTKFRIVSYNILADCYASTDFARTNLFPYCSKKVIDINYRMQLISKELLGYHSDILCLQEVDRFVFEECLAPSFSLYQYASAFANKRNTKEGVALFYNRSKFKLLSVENKILHESLTKDEVNAELYQFVKTNSNLSDRVASLGTCALISTLQSTENENVYLVVVTTHLYYHPRAANVRLVQILVIINLLQKRLQDLKQSLDNSASISCILCGDLNSNPRTGLVEFILSGKLPYSHSDWYSGGITEFHQTKISFNHCFNFKSACGFPSYTNYAAGFNDCLDYIFIDADNLIVDKIIDPPDHESVVEYSGLPSVTAPSDHIAQIVDLSWSPNAK